MIVPITRLEKGELVSQAGLRFLKNGKYGYPWKKQADNVDYKKHNWYGQQLPMIGDLVFAGTGTLSAGVVGKVIDIDHSITCNGYFNGVVKIEKLDGTTDTEWQNICGILTPDQVKEVQDYYIIKENRPDRIKNILV